MDHRTRTWYDEPTDLTDWDSVIGPLAAQIEARFNLTCCQLARTLHTTGVIERSVGRTVPVIVHELEYYEAINRQTEAPTCPDSPTSSPHGSAMAEAFGQFQYPTPPLSIYPEDVISHHRAFIARRRTERPSEEYRELTAAEWAEFLSHFELRKVALGACGRDYATPCRHENACVRCPLLLVDPAQTPRLEKIHANLINRLREAKDQGWLGEMAAIVTTMAAAAQKLEAMRERASQPSTVHLGMPDIRTAAGMLTDQGGGTAG